jgi:predicted DCC family thiol-disulfide oxidoreductase YuxK
MTVSVVRFTIAGAPDSAIAGEIQESQADRPYTVVYDGHCKVCGRLVRLLRWWDKKKILEIIPSQAPGVQARFPWIPARAYLESVQVIGPGGRTWQGAAAIERILNVMPKGKLFSWVFKLPFVRPLAERFYRWFARNRYMLGCGKHCTFRPEDLDYEEEPIAARSAS